VTTGLPEREFHELAPPEGGALAVRREAGRRRRRRAVLTSAGTAVGLLAGVLLLQGSGQPGRESLRVTDLPTSDPSASPASLASPEPSAGTTRAAGPGSSAAPQAGQPVPSATADPRHPSTPATVPYRSPELVREYRDRAVTGTVSVCSGSSSTTGDGGLQSTVNWCQSAVAAPTARGHDLVGELCRDGSSDATLTFPRQQEVELLVRRADGTVVWRWSTGHSDAPDGHTLGVARDHCWSWTAPWTDVDDDGRPLPEGTYQLVVRSRADELRGAPEATVTFTA